MSEEFWEDLYVVDAADAWINGGYDETGDAAYCDLCGEEMRFDENGRVWVCPGCWNVMNRVQWFNHIGANPPGHKCISQCSENYPICKRWCTVYEIDPDDPMM